MTEQVTETNPLLQHLKLPGETFRLPSQGLFYTSGELAEEVKNGELHVYPMTALDEIVMKSPDMLFTGKAIVEVFERCIPQVQKPLELLARDVDYLLACLRVVTYGQTLTVDFTHDCENAKEHQYEVDVRPLIQQARSIDPTTIKTTYVLTLPNGQVVHLRPTTFNTVLELGQASGAGDKEPSLDEVKRSLVSVVADVIDNIDNVHDRRMVSEWVEKAPAGWIKMITDAVDRIGDWGVDFVVPTKCKDCGKPVDLMIGTNPISFFS